MLSLFALNPNMIERPQILYGYVYEQDPSYLILLFELFLWFTFCLQYNQYLQNLIDYFKKTNTDISFLETGNNISVLNWLQKEKDLPFCSIIAEEEKCVSKPECEYNNIGKQCKYKITHKLKDIPQLLLNAVTKVLDLPVPHKVPLIITHFAPEREAPYEPFVHYTCSLFFDLVSFFQQYLQTNFNDLANPSVFLSDMLLNNQCEDVFKRCLLEMSKPPSLWECMDFIYQREPSQLQNTLDKLELLKFHCPTASKLQYLQSRGVRGNVGPMCPPNTCLLALNRQVNLTLSTMLVELPWDQTEDVPAVAVRLSPVQGYNYVWFCNKNTYGRNTTEHVLYSAMWSGLYQHVHTLKQMLAVKPIGNLFDFSDFSTYLYTNSRIKNFLSWAFVPQQVPYFPSLQTLVMTRIDRTSYDKKILDSMLYKLDTIRFVPSNTESRVGLLRAKAQELRRQSFELRRMGKPTTVIQQQINDLMQQNIIETMPYDEIDYTNLGILLSNNRLSNNRTKDENEANRVGKYHLQTITLENIDEVYNLFKELETRMNAAGGYSR
jgi:hypothetical protein